jgi:hypothetical protein
LGLFSENIFPKIIMGIFLGKFLKNKKALQFSARLFQGGKKRNLSKGNM